MKLYNTVTRKEESVAPEELNNAILNGTHTFKADQRVNVIDSNKKSWNVPATELREMLATGQYSLETPDQEAVREFVKENQGIAGVAKVFAGQAADEFLMGIPELVANNTLDPLEIAKKDALKKEHSVANALGGTLGFAGSMLYGGPVGKAAVAATRAGKVAEKAVQQQITQRAALTGAKEVTKPIAASLAKKIAEKSARYGTEGAAFMLPQAVTEAALGDPELAAESLMYGATGGALLGIGGPVVSKITSGFGSVGAKGLEKVSSKFFQRAGIDKESSQILSTMTGANKAEYAQARKAILENDPELFARTVGKITGNKTTKDAAIQNFNQIKQVVDNNPSIVDSLQGAAGFGAIIEYLVPGLGVSLGTVKGILSQTNPKRLVQGIHYTENAMKKVAQGLDSIPSKLGSIGQKVGPAGRMKASGAIGRLMGEKEDATREEKVQQLKKLNQQLSQFNYNPAIASQVNNQLGNLLNNSGAPGVADAFTMKNTLAAKYLEQFIPKPKYIENPLNNREWRPTDQEIASFERRVEALTNPLGVIDQLTDNTLSKEGVQTVKEVYPKLFSRMQEKVLEHFNNNPTNLPYRSRIKLAMLLDLPLGDELKPNNIRALQGNFAEENQQLQLKAPSKQINLPNTSSSMQRLVNRNN